MLGRFFPLLQDDAPFRAVRALAGRLPELTEIHALDECYSVLHQALAAMPDGNRVRRLLETAEPATTALTGKIDSFLDREADNPLRTELLGKRLILLADQMGNSYYLEAQREVAAIKRGSSDRDTLAHLMGRHWYWLGVAHTTRARIDPVSATLAWDGIESLFHSLHALAGRYNTPTVAGPDAPGRQLAYLLLTHDAFRAVTKRHEIGLAARVCQSLAPEVRLAAGFFRQTPLCHQADTGEVRRQIGWRQQAADDAALFFGFDNLASKALDAADRCDREQPPAWLEPDAARQTPSADLIRQLAHAWSEAPGRCRRASARTGTARIAFDFLRVRGLLSQKGKHLPANDPLMLSAAVHDVDEGGFGLLLPEADARLAEAGLMAMHLKRHGWSLAATTRIQPDDNDHYYVAARWLGPDVDAVRLQPENGGERQSAIWVAAGPINQYQASILLAQPSLPPETVCGSDLADKPVRLQIGTPHRLGKNLFQYPARLL